MGFGRSQATLAIDIGSSEITMLALEHKDDSAVVVELGYQPLEPDVIVGGEVMDYHLVVEALRELGRRVKVKPIAVATSVSGRDVIVKRIKMDRMREEEAQQVIRWEAEQHVPFDMNNVNLDFEILDPEEDGLQMDVLIVAAKRDLVETRMRLLQDAGFETTVIDTNAFAVQTAFEHNYEHASFGTFCLVNVGHEVTNLSLIENSRPILTRDLAAGERKFAEALGRELGVSLEEAGNRLHGAEGEGQEAIRVLDQAIDSLVTPIERARVFLSASEGARPQLDEVVLSGPGAGIPGVRDAVASRLQTEVTLLDPLRHVELESGLQTAAETPGERAALAVAVGLGLRGEE